MSGGNILTGLGAVYGPDVVGQAAFDEAQLAVEKGADIYGPDVVDDHPANQAKAATATAPKPAPKPPAAPVTPLPTEADMATLASLDAFLQANPGSLDQAMAAEFSREKPRRGAIEAFLKAERARPEGARPEIITVLEAKFVQE